VATGVVTVSGRNGVSTYTSRGCPGELGSVRRTGDGVQVFVVAAALKYTAAAPADESQA